MAKDYASRGRVPDFSGYPDLIVMYLGMRVRALSGLRTMLGFAPQIDTSGAARPDGLLHYENNIIYKLYPLEVGMRWYWRDMASLEAYSKSEPHRAWWKKHVADAGGVGIWHETYHMRGGMEGVFIDLAGADSGFGRFLPMMPERGTLATRHANYREPDLGHLPVPTPELETSS